MDKSEVLKYGLIVFDGDEKSFNVWLNSEVPALEMKRPITLLDSEDGTRKVMDQLIRMEYSIP